MSGSRRLIAHLLGDYVFQSHWMASKKTSASFPAAAHAAAYVIPFALFGARPRALAVIAGSHFVIDRWRLAKYVVWAKNQLAPAADRPTSVGATGYGPDVPSWLATWLLIWADNALHLLINDFALERIP